MSILKETNFRGIPGWQWNIGPIFIGERGRHCAVEYGKALQCVEEWEKYAKLLQDQSLNTKQLENWGH